MRNSSAKLLPHCLAEPIGGIVGVALIGERHVAMNREFAVREILTKPRSQRTRFPGWSPLLVLVAAFILFGWVTAVCADQVNMPPKAFKAVFSSTVLTDTDMRDAKIAMDLWARQLTKQLPVKSVEIQIARNSGELTQLIRNSGADLITLSGHEYLEIKDQIQVVPLLLGSNNTGKASELLLLVRGGGSITRLQDLRDKTLILPQESKSLLSRIWLDVLLLRAGITDKTKFFQQVKESANNSQAIIAVFFGKADATIVNREAFDTARQLNPQLGLRLKIIDESKSLVQNIACVSQKLRPQYKKMVEDAGLHLHDTVTGRQVLTLFKLDRIIPFQTSNLEGLRELFLERSRLLAKKSKRK